jgi:hypothetical protein
MGYSAIGENNIKYNISVFVLDHIIHTMTASIRKALINVK